MSDRHHLRGQARIAARPLAMGDRAGLHLGAGLLARAASRCTCSPTTSAASRSCPARARYQDEHHRRRTRRGRCSCRGSCSPPPSPAIYARLLRGNLIETMSEDYIRTARAKGLRERRVCAPRRRARRSRRSSRCSASTSASCWAARCSPRRVFNIPGIGRLTYDAIQHGDFPIDPGHDVLALAVCHHREPRRRHRSTPTSIRGCADVSEPHPAAGRGPARPLRDRRRPRPGRRRHHLRRSTAARRSGSSASRARARPSPSLTMMGLTRARSARDHRARSCSRARTCCARRTTSCARSAATTSR